VGLGINVWMFVSQLVSFLILVLVLQRWAFPVLMRTLDKRTLTIQEGVDNAERARRELSEAQQRIEGLMEQARQEAQETLAQAIKAGEHLRTEIEQDAQSRARQILDQAQDRIRQEVAQARIELRQQVADLAILAAERVIGSSLDTATNRRLVDEFVAQSRGMSRET
jgi:F-type H+-transporting ATPase subunit b